MRCRYCNKAISLLRRLNDAEFCSDAHRFSYAEEQQLAMQRLADTQPPMYRTQRTGLARNAQVAPMGGPVPFHPPVIAAGRKAQEIPATLSTPASILLLDREHRFRTGMASSSKPVPLPAAMAAQYAVPALTLGQLPLIHVAVPRALAARFQRTPHWSSRLAADMVSIPIRPSTGPAVEPAAPPLGQFCTVGWLLQPWRRRSRELQPVPNLVRLYTAARDQASTECRHNSVWLAAVTLHWPVSDLTVVAPASPEPSEAGPDPLEQSWTIFEDSPLGALLAATSYPPVTPSAPAAVATRSVPRVSGRVGKPEMSATLRTMCIAATGQPMPGSALLPVALPGVPPLNGSPAGAVSTLPAALGPSVRHLHGPLALAVEAHLRTVHRLQLLAGPSPMVLARTPEANAVPFGGEISRPAKSTLTARWAADFAKADVVLALHPPATAPGQIAAANRGADWRDQFQAPVRPATPLPAASRIIASGSILAVPPPVPPGSVTAPTADGNWIAPSVLESRPGSKEGHGGAAPTGEELAHIAVLARVRRAQVPQRIRAVEGVSLAGRVSFDLCPGAADSKHPGQFLQTLKGVLRVRLPRHDQPMVSRYGLAECVSVPLPGSPSIPWRATCSGGVDLIPPQVLPAHPKPAHSRAPRPNPVKLYRVPNAKPTAQRHDGRPLCYSMGGWGSVPAFQPSQLPFDDGRPRSREISPVHFGQKIREAFSRDQVRNLFGKINHLPSDLKWIAMVVPLIIGIWILARPAATNTATETAVSQIEEPLVPTPSAEDKESQATVAGLAIPPQTRPGRAADKPVSKLLPPAAPGGWDAFTARIAQRASVDLVEEFRNGLSQWDGRGEWARTWSYDRSGTVRPGQLAIFQPTVSMQDYVLEMKAAIDRRSIQWLVRASNPRNYHFARLNVTPGAPLTKLEFERWTVIDGKAGRVTRLPLPHGGSNQTLYSIRVEVKGDSITTYLQDQVIDTFSDARLQEGGVGLMGAGDDRARIYGIHVVHQNDFLGKLCSFLAPQPIHTQGSD